LTAHALFYQSKRYPALLRFVVEQTLAGNADQVKERSIGMEVFGRSPGYDANADPVVRVTAGEIRKRLAQYYYDPSHAGEIRIELPTGSYVPVFQRVVEAATPIPEAAGEPAVGQGAGVEKAAGRESEATEQTAGAGANLAAGVAPGQAGALAASTLVGPLAHRHSSAHLVITVVLVVLALLGGLAGGYWWRHTPAPLPVDRSVEDFWQPMTAGPATVTVCLGEPARDSSKDGDPAQPIQRTKPTEPLYFHLHQSGLFALADVTTLTRVAQPLQAEHKAFRVSAASEASFAQLREGPVVLIGAFDNLWTMRLSRDLRFGFDSVDGTALIVDRKSKSKTTWATAWDTPYEKLARDYAIVARFRDTMTGQPVVMASGISEEGTEAAGELISNATGLGALLKTAPANWQAMNMEAVIETRVIDGHSGPPQVLAVEFW
jgi:hypothetical protein